MAENSSELLEECWEFIMKLLAHQPSHFTSLSLVCKQFLSITSRHFYTIKLSDPTVEAILPRLLHRFRWIKHIDLSGFIGDINSILHQISLSGLYLHSLNISNQSTFPVVGLRALGSKTMNLKSLNCSKIRNFTDSDLNLIADLFSCLEELDISCFDDENGFSRNGLSGPWSISKPISDSGILSLSTKLKNLKKIDVSGNNFITDKSLVFLSTNCLYLCHIVIHCCGFITQNGISKLIRDCGHLNSVSLRGIGVPTGFWTGYRLQRRKSFSTLCAIDLSICAISDELLYTLAEAHLPIKKLILCSCRDYSFAGISCLLNEYQSLEYLDLQGADFLTDRDMAELSRFLRSIKYINLSCCKGLTSITFYTITRNCLILEKMEMAKTSIGDENIETDLEANHGIKHLNLALNSAMGNNFLSSVASTCPSLELLELSYCEGITEEGIVQVLTRCSKIRELQAHEVNVMKNVFTYLGSELPKLKVLSLSFSTIDDNALAMIGKICPMLLELDLDCCSHLTSKGVKEVVENCKELREIHLRWCDYVSDDIVPWMVFSRPSLKRIVPPSHFVPTESLLNLFLRHGCLVG